LSKRKSSSAVTLVLIGAASLTGCDNAPPQTRDLYRSRSDCVQDWGDASKCEPAAFGDTTAGGGMHYWYGPSYPPRPADPAGRAVASNVNETITQPRPGSHAIATHVSRGGFGSSGASHARSGS